MTIEKIFGDVKAHKGDIGIGQLTHRVRALPPAERARAIASLSFLESIEAAGRHGDKNAAWDVLGVTDKAERETAERVLSACQVDDVALRVVARLGGSDAEVLPLPELTRADHIAAAMDIHNEEN